MNIYVGWGSYKLTLVGYYLWLFLVAWKTCLDSPGHGYAIKSAHSIEFKGRGSFPRGHWAWLFGRAVLTVTGLKASTRASRRIMDWFLSFLIYPDWSCFFTNTVSKHTRAGANQESSIIHFQVLGRVPVIVWQAHHIISYNYQHLPSSGQCLPPRAQSHQQVLELRVGSGISWHKSLLCPHKMSVLWVLARIHVAGIRDAFFMWHHLSKAVPLPLGTPEVFGESEMWGSWE